MIATSWRWNSAIRPPSSADKQAPHMRVGQVGVGMHAESVGEAVIFGEQIGRVGPVAIQQRDIDASRRGLIAQITRVSCREAGELCRRGHAVGDIAD